MRSGQYKLAGAGSRGAESQVTVVGHFRSSQSDLPPPESLVGDFPHMNSLVVTKNKLSDSRAFNKSCENLSTSGGGARSAVTRVEQRVKSFLQRGESRLRHSGNGAPVEDVWQYGHIVTLPRRPRLSLALSHSALHHLSSDTASCLSGSSGYSSSSSSSYGSFKSSTSSSCSTLPRKKSRSECSALPSEGDMPPPLTRSCTLVDNPMYDVMPATNPRNFSRNKSPKRRGSPPPRNEPLYDLTPDSDPYNLDNCEAREGSPSTDDPIYDVIPGGDPRNTCRESLVECHNQLYDLARPSRLLTPDSGTHGGLDSLEESALDSLDCSDPQNGMLEDEFFEEEDQVAKECREYFERRLKNSETLKKRWSMCSSDSGADPGDSDVSATSLPTSGDPLSIASNTSSTSDDSKTSTSDEPNTSHSSSATQVTATPKKTPLDQKMEFLRKEIASLMNQDNALFRQLLTLHDSISALKTSPAHAYRPPSPASLDSFTEEEDDDDDEEDEDDDDQVVVGRTQQKTGGRDDNLSDVDEGLEMDHSTSHSTSPTSTLSSNSSRDSQFSCYSKVEYHSPHHMMSDSSNTSDVGTNNPTAHTFCTKNNIDINYSSSSTRNNKDPCNSITNFTSNINRRYSITTNEDFNINITINNDDSSLPNTASQLSSSTSCLSKSSCYLSNKGPDINDLDMDTLGGGLGSFSPSEGRHFVRTRVSIPPSARNRDRSARPESFRLSSDMATHTKVLLKARSFAGASLRESPTRKINGGRNFARTSLRENRLTYHREKGQNQQNAMSKMEFLQARFANTFGATSSENTCETPSYDCVIISSSSLYDGTRKPDKKGCTQEFIDKDKVVSERSAEVYTSLEATNIVIVNTPKPEEHLENTKDCWKQGNSNSLQQAGITEGDTFILPSDELYNNIANQTLRECALSPLDQVLSSHNAKEKDPDTHNQPTHKVSLTVPNSYMNENDQDAKLQKLRTRSFTGMVTPREAPPDHSSPREILDSNKINKKGTPTLSLRITQGTESQRIVRVATMSRRAQVTRDGYAFRFSSDLGLGASSKVNPKSKREVFV